MKTYFNFLKNVYFFDTLSDTEIHKIESVCKEENFKAGETIVLEGTFGDRFFIILDGYVEIWKGYNTLNADLLAVFEARQLFGELSLIDNSMRNATVVAQTDCCLLSIKRSDFEKIIVKSANISQCLMKSISTMLRSQTETFIERLRKEKGDLKQAYLELKREIDERYLLEECLRQAQKMEAVGTLAAGIAHDFNNLLQAIQGNASLILLNTNKDHPNYKRLKNIETYINNGSLLTQSMLGFASVSNCVATPVVISEILKNTLRIDKKQWANICICENYQEDLWHVMANPQEIIQVFSNLLTNASEAMPAGGTLYLKTKNLILNTAKARLIHLSAGYYIKINIQDTGIGMDGSIQNRIFEPFFTTKHLGRGKGLSLASVYNIIKCHDGTIQVKSKKGRGTLFVIYLPAIKSR